MDLLVVDPAARRFDYAVALGGVVVATGSLRNTLANARALVARVPKGGRVIAETPRNLDAFAVAHADLDDLRLTVRRLRRASTEAGLAFEVVYPSTWKGNVPKDVHHRRVRAAMTPEELALIPAPGAPGYDHNQHDAAALALTALGRVGRGGVRA